MTNCRSNLLWKVKKKSERVNRHDFCRMLLTATKSMPWNNLTLVLKKLRNRKITECKR